MKNLIYLLLILVVSCTAKKVVTKSETAERVTRQNAVTDVKTDQSRAIVSEVGKLTDSTQTVTKTIKYDTTKPIQAETGKAPVIEETTITQTKIGNKVVSTKTETANNTKSEVTDNSKIKSEVKEESKTIETPRAGSVKYYFYILIIILALGAGFWIYKKLKP